MGTLIIFGKDLTSGADVAAERQVLLFHANATKQERKPGQVDSCETWQ